MSRHFYAGHGQDGGRDVNVEDNLVESARKRCKLKILADSVTIFRVLAKYILVEGPLNLNATVKLLKRCKHE